MNTLRTLVVPALALTLVVGCGRPSAGTGKGSASPRHLVVFSQCNNAEPYRAAQNKLLTKLCATREDIELVITDAQQDNSKQIAQIETVIRQRPDVLIVAPNERNPLTAIMGKAMAAGIPTICLERDIVEPNYTTYVRCDNYAIGKLAGQFVVDALTKKYGEPKGKVVELRGLLGVEGEINRYQGAHDVWAEHPGIEVLHEAVADWLQSLARERMTEALNAHSEIDVVYGHNDPMAVGAYLAAKEKGREADMLFVGVDGLGGEGGGIRKVMDGVLAVTFCYPLCVDKAFEIACRVIDDPEGYVAPKTVTMESAMITPDNAAEMYEQYTF
jgi:ribose transport system substrate-binding protein